jgi:hypothetical protein
VRDKKNLGQIRNGIYRSQTERGAEVSRITEESLLFLCFNFQLISFGTLCSDFVFVYFFFFFFKNVIKIIIKPVFFFFSIYCKINLNSV